MSSVKDSFQEVSKKVEREYQKFLDNFGWLKKEQGNLVDNYREKLEQKKIARLREELKNKK